jgi:large subunit ribosomal protein L9
VRRAASEKGDAQALGQQVEAVTLSFTRKSGERDQLFGSVTSADIASELEHKGVQIDRRKIQLDEPLKHVGEFNVPVKLHKDVTVQLKVVINKEASAEAAPVGEAGAEA